MNSGATPGKLTYDDFLLFPDDGQRHELIDGAHCVTPAPGRKHQTVVTRLIVEIQNFLDLHPIGEVYPAPFDVVLSLHDVVEPDLLFVRNDRLHILTDANATAAPDLAVEVVSPSTRGRDHTLKRDLYDRASLEEYWLVDPDRSAVMVYRRAGGTLGQQGELGGADVLTTPLLPGFALSVERLFR